MRHQTDTSRQRGSATVELVVLAPAALLVLTLVSVGGRVVLSSKAVETAAAAGARAASLVRGPAAARAAAGAAVQQSIVDQRLSCDSLSVAVDTSGYSAPLGEPAAVAVDVSCRVPLEDSGGWLPSRVVAGHAVSSLDPYRGRAP
jgi:Flp pilus assembly protein TadG